MPSCGGLLHRRAGLSFLGRHTQLTVWGHPDPGILAYSRTTVCSKPPMGVADQLLPCPALLHAHTLIHYNRPGSQTPSHVCSQKSHLLQRTFPGASTGKASAHTVGDPGLIPGLGRSPGEGSGNLLQYSCLENSMDGGSWWATVQGGTKSRT